MARHTNRRQTRGKRRSQTKVKGRRTQRGGFLGLFDSAQDKINDLKVEAVDKEKIIKAAEESKKEIQMKISELERGVINEEKPFWSGIFDSEKKPDTNSVSNSYSELNSNSNSNSNSYSEPNQPNNLGPNQRGGRRRRRSRRSKN